MIGVMFLNDVMGWISRFQQCGLFTENTFDVKLKVTITSTGENAIKVWCDFIISTSILRLLFLFEVMTIKFKPPYFALPTPCLQVVTWFQITFFSSHKTSKLIPSKLVDLRLCRRDKF